MENWGLLTMDSESFLVNATTESTHELVKSSNIICHEIAHQWFGDLVTMEWWDNIWLNEGFATLFSFLCVDYVRRGDQTILPHVAGLWESTKGDARSLFHIHINQQHEGIGSSSGPHQNALRSQAHSGAALSHSVGFNSVAYAKAGATLGMAMDTMERLRPGSFSTGLEAYLRMDAFGNSVPMDLWSNLGTAVGDPLFGQRMLTWSENGGFPLVTATVTATQLILRQVRLSNRTVCSGTCRCVIVRLLDSSDFGYAVAVPGSELSHALVHPVGDWRSDLERSRRRNPCCDLARNKRAPCLT